ncbi:hypothetical protein BT69DRAFT_1340709 [Atractiella rhizophila]|nr:hypothetical protein BT69DRAFT_1340709 [Atractiella rhizophila]
MSTIADLLDRTVLPWDTRLRKAVTIPKTLERSIRLRPYHLRRRPRLLEDVCDATERILGPQLASDQLQSSLHQLPITDAFEEATNLILEFECDPANQGTRTDGGLLISTNYGDQIVAMGKSDDGYGTNLYHAGDGTEAGARSIVTKPTLWWNVLHLFQRDITSDRSYRLCSDRCNVVGSLVIKTITGSVWRMQSSNRLPITLPSGFKFLHRHLKFHLLRSLILGSRAQEERTHDVKQRNLTTRSGLDVVFTSSVLNSRLYPVRPVDILLPLLEFSQ